MLELNYRKLIAKGLNTSIVLDDEYLNIHPVVKLCNNTDPSKSTHISAISIVGENTIVLDYNQYIEDEFTFEEYNELKVLLKKNWSKIKHSYNVMRKACNNYKQGIPNHITKSMLKLEDYTPFYSVHYFETFPTIDIPNTKFVLLNVVKPELHFALYNEVTRAIYKFNISYNNDSVVIRDYPYVYAKRWYLNDNEKTTLEEYCLGNKTYILEVVQEELEVF